MLQIGHAIGAIVVVGLLFGLWAARRRITCRTARQAVGRPAMVGGAGTARPLDRIPAGPPEHITTVVRRTEAVLTTMARTIAQERRKLNALATGVTVPGSGQANASTGPAHPDPAMDVRERILPLAGKGETVSAIANRLELPEAEVSLVIRLNAV